MREENNVPSTVAATLHILFVIRFIYHRCLGTVVVCVSDYLEPCPTPSCPVQHSKQFSSETEIKELWHITLTGKLEIPVPCVD